MSDPDTAIIPCGGLGTRMQPITRWLPKELLPVGLSPLIHWALTEAADAGLARAIVVTNPAKPLLGAGVRCGATFYDVGVPEGYRRAVADFPTAAGEATK